MSTEKILQLENYIITQQTIIKDVNNMLKIIEENLLEEYRKIYPTVFCVGVKYIASHDYCDIDHVFGYYSDMSLAQKHKPTRIYRGRHHAATNNDVYIKEISSDKVSLQSFRNLDKEAVHYCHFGD